MFQKTDAMGLKEFWNMTQPTVVFGVGGSSGSGSSSLSSGLDFELEYQLSDGITNDMIQIELWDKDCQLGGSVGGGDNNPLLAVTSTSTSYSSSLPSSLLEVIKTDLIGTGIDVDGYSSSPPETQRFRTIVRWKTENLEFGQQLLDSPFFTESSDGSFAQISACVRCQLHTQPSSNNEYDSFEVNFLETPVNVNVDFEGGVSMGVGFHLTSAEDPCIEDLQRMSTGGRDYDGSNNNDDIFFSPPGDYSSMTLYKMLDYHSDEDSSMTISSFESSNDFYSYFPPLSSFSSSSSAAATTTITTTTTTGTYWTITNCLIMGMTILFLVFSLI